MHGLTRLAGVLCSLLVTLACGTRVVLGQEHISADEAARVEVAIQVLEAKALFLAAEQGADPAFVKRFGHSVKALRHVFGEKSDGKDHGRILKGGLPQTVSGSQPGSGQELNDKDEPIPEGDKVMKGLGPNRIQIQPNFVSENAKDCNLLFVGLLHTLLHEATHLNQVPGGLPADEKGLKEASDTEAKATQLLDAKLREIKNEIDAHGDEQRLLDQLLKALTAIEDNPATVPAWAVHWKDCSHKDLETLKAVVRINLSSKADTIAKLEAMKADVEGQQNAKPKTQTDQVFTLALDRSDSFVKIIGGGAHKDVNIEVNYLVSTLTVDSAEGGLLFLETGIAHPQDVLQIQASDGSFKLLVCGVTDLGSPLGIIRVFDEPTTGGVTGTGDAARFIATAPPTLDLGTVPYSTICEANPFLIQPTSLVMTPDGKTYVWDAGASALYPIMASHGDGVPDRVDLTRSLVRIPPAFDLRHLTTLSPVNGGLVLGWRVGLPVDSGDPVVFNFRDQDSDGVFETVRPTNMSRLLDAVGH